MDLAECSSHRSTCCVCMCASDILSDIIGIYSSLQVSESIYTVWLFFPGGQHSSHTHTHTLYGSELLSVPVMVFTLN